LTNRNHAVLPPRKRRQTPVALHPPRST
jgi:hypothetical protein